MQVDLEIFCTEGGYLYEFRDKEHFQAAGANGGTIDHNRNEKLKAFSLQGYEVLVDIRNQLHCLILNPLPSGSFKMLSPQQGRFTRFSSSIY